ncbi:MAG: purine-nucleoside phosphorylase [Planctomycetota bacterium]
MKNNIKASLEYLRKRLNAYPKLAVILGSGLGYFADRLKEPYLIKTADIPSYPRATVEGHEGTWLIGKVGKHKILVLKGRVHFYEGYTMEEVTFPVRLLAELGVTHLIVTNAAGSLNPQIRPGDLMLIDDHINFFFKNPLISREPISPEKRFVDLSAPYDPSLIELAEAAAHKLGLGLRKGVLVGSTGPSYESAAEVRMMQILGGDAGSMSTVPEVLVANQMGMRVLGLSCITNMTTGLSENKLDHSEVTEIAAMVGEKFESLMEEIILQIFRTSNLD